MVRASGRADPRLLKAGKYGGRRPKPTERGVSSSRVYSRGGWSSANYAIRTDLAAASLEVIDPNPQETQGARRGLERLIGRVKCL